MSRVVQELRGRLHRFATKLVESMAGYLMSVITRPRGLRAAAATSPVQLRSRADQDRGHHLMAHPPRLPQCSA
jgi:hypothetical protein